MEMPSFRRVVGFIALAAVLVSWIDLIPGDEIILSAVLGPLAIWGLTGP